MENKPLHAGLKLHKKRENERREMPRGARKERQKIFVDLNNKNTEWKNVEI
jgi:hypothetical protein